MSQNHFILKLKIKTNNHYTKNINQWHFLSATKFNAAKIYICCSEFKAFANYSLKVCFV